MPDDVTARPGRAYGEGRAALLDAAVQVVAQRGLRHLTYRAMAERAGVAHGLVAHHFDNRDALLAAALEHSLEASVGSITSRPGSGDLDALFVGLVDLVDGQADDQVFQYELILESRRRPELKPQVKALYAGYRSALAVELHAAGVPTDDGLVHLVFGALDGLVFQMLCLGERDELRAALDQLRSLIAELVQRRGGGRGHPAFSVGRDGTQSS